LSARVRTTFALGITTEGRKVLLGLWEGSTENATLARALLSDLVDRGLDPEQGILFVIDGSEEIATDAGEWVVATPAGGRARRAARRARRQSPAPPWRRSGFLPGSVERGLGGLGGGLTFHRVAPSGEVRLSADVGGHGVTRAIEMRSPGSPALVDSGIQPGHGLRHRLGPLAENTNSVQAFHAKKRRGRDSNPRGALRRLTVFETHT